MAAILVIAKDAGDYGFYCQEQGLSRNDAMYVGHPDSLRGRRVHKDAIIITNRAHENHNFNAIMAELERIVIE